MGVGGLDQHGHDDNMIDRRDGHMQVIQMPHRESQWERRIAQTTLHTRNTVRCDMDASQVLMSGSAGRPDFA